MYKLYIDILAFNAPKTLLDWLLWNTAHNQNKYKLTEW